MEISTFKVSTHFRELRNYRHVQGRMLAQSEKTSEDTKTSLLAEV
jgi:hypothetical protein